MKVFKERNNIVKRVGKDQNSGFDRSLMESWRIFKAFRFISPIYYFTLVRLIAIGTPKR